MTTTALHPTKPTINLDIYKQSVPAPDLDLLDLPVADRVLKYDAAKIQNVRMVEFIKELCERDRRDFGSANPFILKLYERMSECGSFLTFRHYLMYDQNRLTSANFCGKHLLCQACAIRRGGQMLRRYMERIEHVLKSDCELRAYMVTFTVRNGPDLKERFNHLHESIRMMLARRRKYLSRPARYQHTEMAKVEGAVYSYEVPRSRDGQGWHPHIHMLVLSRTDIDAGWVDVQSGQGTGLRGEWFGVTGDSYQVDVRPAYGTSIKDACCEVLKYAVKFSAQDPEDTWRAFQLLHGRRLVASFGNLRGVKLPTKLVDDKLDGPYVEYMYRFIDGHYRREYLEDHRDDYRTGYSGKAHLLPTDPCTVSG